MNWSIGGTETTHYYSQPVDFTERTLTEVFSSSPSPVPPLGFNDGAGTLPSYFDTGSIQYSHANQALMTRIQARVNVPLHTHTSLTLGDGTTNPPIDVDTGAFVQFILAQPQDHSQPYPMKLDSSYGIQAGQVVLQNVSSASASDNITLSWTATPAQYPPDPNAARATRQRGGYSAVRLK